MSIRCLGIIIAHVTNRRALGSKTEHSASAVTGPSRQSVWTFVTQYRCHFQDLPDPRQHGKAGSRSRFPLAIDESETAPRRHSRAHAKSKGSRALIHGASDGWPFQLMSVSGADAKNAVMAALASANGRFLSWEAAPSPSAAGRGAGRRLLPRWHGLAPRRRLRLATSRSPAAWVSDSSRMRRAEMVKGFGGSGGLERCCSRALRPVPGLGRRAMHRAGRRRLRHEAAGRHGLRL
jgi:hypothetical protein